jgi:hypothetical protein
MVDIEPKRKSVHDMCVEKSFPNWDRYDSFTVTCTILFKWKFHVSKISSAEIQVSFLFFIFFIF